MITMGGFVQARKIGVSEVNLWSEPIIIYGGSPDDCLVKARRRCLHNYPMSEGWTHHVVALTCLDGEQVNWKAEGFDNEVNYVKSNGEHYGR